MKIMIVAGVLEGGEREQGYKSLKKLYLHFSVRLKAFLPVGVVPTRFRVTQVSVS